MTYNKQTWVDNSAAHPVSAARLNHMEDGIYKGKYKEIARAISYQSTAVTSTTVTDIPGLAVSGTTTGGIIELEFGGMIGLSHASANNTQVRAQIHILDTVNAWNYWVGSYQHTVFNSSANPITPARFSLLIPNQPAGRYTFKLQARLGVSGGTLTVFGATSIPPQTQSYFVMKELYN